METPKREAGDRLCLIMDVGSVVDSKKPLKVTVMGRLPLAPPGMRQVCELGPYQVPVEDAERHARQCADALPNPAGDAAKALVGFVRLLEGDVRIILGDRTEDGRTDVTVTMAGKMFPAMDRADILELGPFNLPTEQVLSACQVVAGVLPSPANQVASVLLGVVKLVLT